MKRPAFQFYPADWRKDADLQSCSIGARGLWVEMLCVMHECTPYGHLCVNGKPMTEGQLARLVGEPVKPTLKWLAELEAAAVFSRDDQGRIYSRRMVKDERLRNIRAEAGAMGGNPALLASKDKQKVNQTDNHSDKQSPTPSSSSSSSSTKNKSNGADAPPSWVPEIEWRAYVAMRQKIRKPLTDHAVDLIFAKLKRFESAGYDIAEVLNYSVMNSYQGIFEPKAKTGNKPQPPWFLSQSAINAKGDELGIDLYEPWVNFRDEVYRAAGITPAMIKQAEADWK